MLKSILFCFRYNRTIKNNTVAYQKLRCPHRRGSTVVHYHLESILWKPRRGEIYISGTDVYTAGDEFKDNTLKRIAKYWKNGNPVSLTADADNGIATSIVVK